MAQSVIGALRVNLGLDSAKFTRGLSDAQKSMKEARKQFAAVASLAIAAAGGLSALTISTSKAAAEIKLFSQVANAAPAELQKWAAGAITVGIEQEKLADILKDVNDRVGDFLTTGGGPMADFFENVAPKIGLTANAFRNLSGPQSLQLYVSSLEKAGLSQQEMTFYLEAMASDATALIPLLKNNGVEMQRLGENASSLGGVMSSETVVSMSLLKTALRDTSTALQGVGYRISGEVAPALTALVTSFNDAMREGGALRVVIDGLIDNLDRISTYVAVAVAAFGVRYVAALGLAALSTASLSGALVFLRGALIRTGIGLLVVGAAELVFQLGRVIKASGGVGEAISRIYDVGKATFLGVGNTAWGLMEILAGVASAITGSFVRAFALIAKSWDMLINGMSSAWNMLAGSSLGDTLGLGKIGASDISGTIGAVADGLFDQAEQSIRAGGKRIADAGKSVADALKKSVEPVGDLSDEIEEGTGATEDLNNALDDLGGSGGKAGKAAKALKKVKTEAEAYNDALKEAADTSEDIGTKKAGILIGGIDGVADAFGDFIGGGLKNFKDFAKSIVSSFTGMISKMIALAARNKIMLGLGISPAGLGGAASAGVPGGGGLLGSLMGGGGAAGGGGMLGGIMGGIGALTSGLGAGFSMSLGGLMSGGLGGMTGVIGTQLGAATASMGAFGAAIGAVALPLLAVGAVFSFFKKKTKELDAGLRVTVTGVDALVESFRTIETKRFWGLSKKVRTSYAAAAAEVADPIEKIVGDIQGSILGAAAALNIGSGAFENFAHTLSISTKGLSEADAQAAISEALTGLGDAFAGMIPDLAALQKSGEGASEALGRLSSRLSGVNGVFDLLGLQLYQVSLSGADAASTFVDLFDTIDNFNAVTSSYYSNFYTEAERTAKATQLLTDSLFDLGIDALPATRAAFRSLVDEAKSLGDDDLLSSLLKISPAFAEITAATDALAQSARALITEDFFATGFDYSRSIARGKNGLTYEPPRTSNAFGSAPSSPQDTAAELRGIRADLQALQSTMQITAANTGRAADAADDSLAVTLGGTL